MAAPKPHPPPPPAPAQPPKAATALAPVDPLIGAQLGEYLVEKSIGSGGMGVVYRGVQPMIGKSVAIKVLQWETARNPEEVQRLLSEARLVNAIRHRGIVDIFAFGATPDGRNYLVMELLEGEPLDVIIAKRAPLPVNEVLDILDEVLDALGAAHAAGVIHRDLKPQNVFLVSPPHGKRYVKLLDFGLAKKSLTPGGTAAQTRASMIVGTPYYMAPEQARGEEISPQTDLYALGVLAYELLTSRLPFEAPTPFEVISQHLNTPAPRVRSLERSTPEELDEMVARMLNKAPADRPPSASELRRELERLAKRLHSDATQIGEPAPRALIEEPAAPPPPVVEVAAPPAGDDDASLELADGPTTQPLTADDVGVVVSPDLLAPPVEASLELADGPPTPQLVETAHQPAPPFRPSASLRRSRADLPRDIVVPVARRKRNWKPLWGTLVALLVLAIAAYAALLFRPGLAAYVPFDLTPLQLERVRSMLPRPPTITFEVVPAKDEPTDAPEKAAEPKAEPPKAAPAKDSVKEEPAPPAARPGEPSGSAKPAEPAAKPSEPTRKPTAPAKKAK